MTVISRVNRLSRLVFFNTVIRGIIDTVPIGGICFFLTTWQEATFHWHFSGILFTGGDYFCLSRNYF